MTGRSHAAMAGFVNKPLASEPDWGYIGRIETVGGTSVSSGSRGEDGYHESAGAVHFHVASPAQNSKKAVPYRTAFSLISKALTACGLRM